MSIIMKVVCNRCGTITNGEPNLIIKGEKFSLCENCLEHIIDFLTNPAGSDVDNVLSAISENEQQQEKEKTISKDVLPFNYSEKNSRSSYTQWDEYRIKGLIDLRKKGLTWKQIADALCTTTAAVGSIVHRIRTARRGYDLYPYQQKLQEAEEK